MKTCFPEVSEESSSLLQTEGFKSHLLLFQVQLRDFKNTHKNSNMKVFSLRSQHDNVIRKLMMRLLSFPFIWDDSMVYYHINTLLCIFCSCVQFLFLEIVYIVCLHSWDQCLGCSGKLAVGIQLQLWKHSNLLAPWCRDLWDKSVAGGRPRNSSEIKQPPPDQPSHSR